MKEILEKPFLNFEHKETFEKIEVFFSKEINNYLQADKTTGNKIANISKKINIVEKIIKIVELVTSNPLINHQELCSKINIKDRQILKLLFKIIKNINSFQEIIIKKGLGTKYYKNLIIPLIKSNSIEDFLNKKYSYPFRVGLFPGLSCMFKCSFCGRNYDAVYKRDYGEKGIQIFKNIIDEAPNNDPSRFFISGGLEPLTNPKISELIDYLKFKKFNASMYTNGYMMTPKFMEKNPAIFDLDSLRISFYGIDDNKTFNVTKKKQAFKIVTNNIINYLKLKEKKNSKTSFGINFVILQNGSKDIIDLFSLISKINFEVGNNKNNFNFVTLREDFRILGNRLSEKERVDLSKNIKIVTEMIKNDKYLSNIHVDYGFALEPIRNGYIGDKFENNFASKKDLEILGVPQARVVVDLYGDIYLFGESGFLDRPGVKRYILGNLFEKKTMSNVVKDFINRQKKIEIFEDDRDFLDAWDHIAIKLAQQQKQNKEFGILPTQGFLDIDYITKMLNINYKVHYSS